MMRTKPKKLTSSVKELLAVFKKTAREHKVIYVKESIKGYSGNKTTFFIYNQPNIFKLVFGATLYSAYINPQGTGCFSGTIILPSRKLNWKKLGVLLQKYYTKLAEAMDIDEAEMGTTEFHLYQYDEVNGEEVRESVYTLEIVPNPNVINNEKLEKLLGY